MKLEHGTCDNLDPCFQGYDHSNVAPEHSISSPLCSENYTFCVDNGVLVSFNVLLLYLFCYFFLSLLGQGKASDGAQNSTLVGSYDFKPDFDCISMLAFVW